MASSTKLTVDINKEMALTKVLTIDIKKEFKKASSTALTSDDNVYLAKVVGEPLAKCLEHLVLTFPADPFECIAHYLYKWHDNSIYFAERQAMIQHIVSMKKVSAQEKKSRDKKMKALRNTFVATKGTLKSMGVASSKNESASKQSLFSFPEGTANNLFPNSAGVSRPNSTGKFQVSSRQASRNRINRSRKITAIGSEGELFTDGPDGETNMHSLNGFTMKKTRDGRISMLSDGGTEYELDEDNNLIQRRTSIAIQIEHNQIQKMLAEHGGEIDSSGIPDGDSVFPEADLAGFKFFRMPDGRLGVMSKGGGEYVLDDTGTLIQTKASRHHAIALEHMKNMLMEIEQEDDPKSKAKQTGLATWGVNCRLGLVCRHPVLGDMEPRPPLMYAETPEWWDRKGYLPETTYDHEVYSRANDDTIRNWDKMDHITYKEFVEEGPWLFQGLLKNTQPSYAEMVQMPVGFNKRIRKHKEGDSFPKGFDDLNAEQNDTASKGSGKTSIKPDSKGKGKNTPK